MSKLTKEDIEFLKNKFKEMDTNGNGTISVEEFSEALKKENLSIPHEEIVAHVKEADTDNSGEIDFNEFVAKIEKNL